MDRDIPNSEIRKKTNECKLSKMESAEENKNTLGEVINQFNMEFDGVTFDDDATTLNLETMVESSDISAEDTGNLSVKNDEESKNIPEDDVTYDEEQNDHTATAEDSEETVMNDEDQGEHTGAEEDTEEDVMEQFLLDTDYTMSESDSSETSDDTVKKPVQKSKYKSTKVFPCVQCPEVFKVGKRLRAHVAIVHEGNPPFQCEICHKPIAEKYKLIDHMKTHSNEREFGCDECGKTFKFKSNLTSHYKLYHGPEKDDRYPCELCPKVFATRFRLKNHLVIHSDICKYSCEICGRKFKRSTNLQEHKRIHSEEKKFACPKCGLLFKRKYDLTVHGRNHMEVKPYKCEFCPSSFTQMHALKNHVRLHTGERPYKCHICQRSFVQQGTLQVHVKRHTGEKDYKCEFCGQAFMLKRGLVDHIRIHTGEKPYECPQCPYRSATSVGLACHIKTHERRLKRQLEKEKLLKEMGIVNSNDSINGDDGNADETTLDMSCQDGDEDGKSAFGQKLVVKIGCKRKRKSPGSNKKPKRKTKSDVADVRLLDTSSTTVEEVNGDFDIDINTSELNVIEISQDNEPLPVMLFKNKAENEVGSEPTSSIEPETSVNVEDIMVKQSPDPKLSHPTLFTALKSNTKTSKKRTNSPQAKAFKLGQKASNGTLNHQKSTQTMREDNVIIDIKLEPVDSMKSTGDIHPTLLSALKKDTYPSLKSALSKSTHPALLSALTNDNHSTLKSALTNDNHSTLKSALTNNTHPTLLSARKDNTQSTGMNNTHPTLISALKNNTQPTLKPALSDKTLPILMSALKDNTPPTGMNITHPTLMSALTNNSQSNSKSDITNNAHPTLLSALTKDTRPILTGVSALTNEIYQNVLASLTNDTSFDQLQDQNFSVGQKNGNCTIDHQISKHNGTGESGKINIKSEPLESTESTVENQNNEKKRDTSFQTADKTDKVKPTHTVQSAIDLHVNMQIKTEPLDL